MRLRQRTSPELNGDTDIDLSDAAWVNPADALALAEEAEAEAAEAEALANAARARARALKLRRQAEAADADAKADTATAVEPAVTTTLADRPIDGSAIDRAALDEAPDDGAHDSQQTPTPRRRLKRWRIKPKAVATTLVIVCTAGLLAVSGYMIWQHRQVAAEQQRSAEFAAAAGQAVVTLMSLDFNHAQEDVQRIVDNSTGDFKKDFQNATTDFTTVAQQSKVITTATVNAAAVESMTHDTATVLVSATTHVSNAASKDQQPRTWRLLVDVVRDGGQIKLAKVEFVP